MVQRAYQQFMESERVRRFARRADLIGAILLGIATIGSAWSAYEAARWISVVRATAGTVQKLRLQGLQAQAEARKELVVDSTLFERWTEAALHGDQQVAKFVQDRFPGRFRPAFDAWMATSPGPGQLPQGSPFERPEYRIEAQDKADALEQQANQFSTKSRQAIDNNNNFVLNSVLFSTVMFLAGLTSHLRGNTTRMTMIVLAAIMLVCIFIGFFRLPHLLPG
jgi:hypothetical protein